MEEGGGGEKEREEGEKLADFGVEGEKEAEVGAEFGAEFGAEGEIGRKGARGGREGRLDDVDW